MNDWVNDIHQGDVVDTLRELPESSVHMAMTSPPYYGLRDYGEDGQIGLEETLAEYIGRLVDVGDELRRVLRDDGSWWLNLGDSYSGTGTGQPADSYKESVASPPPVGKELGKKNKMLVPHRTAIALQEAGWIVRNDAVWAKPNPMPESVTDRLSTTFEFVFHLVPEPNYWYDLDAIREPHTSDRTYRGGSIEGQGGPRSRKLDTDGKFGSPAGKNPGDVFEVTTKPYPDAHFAVYPPELCEKPIKATCPPKVCAECGVGYVRDKTVHSGGGRNIDGSQMSERGVTRTTEGLNLKSNEEKRHRATFHGWEPDCDCDTDETKPGIVLDPFAGAGTTCLVAKRLGRRFVGIDLNPEYVAMAQARVGITVDNPEYLTDNDQTGLTAYSTGGDE